MPSGPQPSIRGGIVKRGRDGADELDQQEDEEGITARNFGTSSGRKVFDPAEPLEQDVLRHHGDLERQHDRAQHQGEQQRLEGKLQPGERERRERAGAQVADHGQRGDHSELTKNAPNGMPRPVQPSRQLSSVSAGAAAGPGSRRSRRAA